MKAMTALLAGVSSIPTGPLDTQSITPGHYRPGGGGGAPVFAGFNSGVYGSISDGTSNVYGGAAILELASEDDGAGAFTTIWKVAGTQPNSGWSTISFGSYVLNRVDAIYYGGTNTSWSWPGTDNLFGDLPPGSPVVWS